jgi:hypothetical protein
MDPLMAPLVNLPGRHLPRLHDMLRQLLAGASWVDVR